MPSWGFAEGQEIVPGRIAMELLGTGLRYETHLAWDEHLRALVVTKVLLPELVGDARRLTPWLVSFASG